MGFGLPNHNTHLNIGCNEVNEKDSARNALAGPRELALAQGLDPHREGLDPLPQTDVLEQRCGGRK